MYTAVNLHIFQTIDSHRSHVRVRANFCWNKCDPIISEVQPPKPRQADEEGIWNTGYVVTFQI